MVNFYPHSSEKKSPMNLAIGVVLLFSTHLTASSSPLASKDLNLESLLFKYAKKSLFSNVQKRNELNAILEDGAHSLPVSECMTVLMETGNYHFESVGNENVCGVYMASDANYLVEVEITDFDVTCESGGLVSFFDGWELNEKVFPSKIDHPIAFEDRFKEFCVQDKLTTTKSKTLRFVASQNAAVIQYRVPVAGQGFSFKFNVVQNLEPCNVLMTVNQGTFNLRNEGRPKNCSLTTLLFPASLKIVSMNVGVKRENEDGVDVFNLNKDKREAISCHQRNNEDYIEFGGSAQLDPSELSMKQTFCGLKTKPATKALTVLCGSTTVRLVSSGRYENTLVVQVKEAEEEDLNQSTNFVMMCPDYL